MREKPGFWLIDEAGGRLTHPVSLASGEMRGARCWRGETCILRRTGIAARTRLAACVRQQSWLRITTGPRSWPLGARSRSLETRRSECESAHEQKRDWVVDRLLL